MEHLLRAFMGMCISAWNNVAPHCAEVTSWAVEPADVSLADVGEDDDLATPEISCSHYGSSSLEKDSSISS